jgi:hypothetical protein
MLADMGTSPSPGFLNMPASSGGPCIDPGCGALVCGLGGARILGGDGFPVVPNGGCSLPRLMMIDCQFVSGSFGPSKPSALAMSAFVCWMRVFQNAKAARATAFGYTMASSWCAARDSMERSPQKRPSQSRISLTCVSSRHVQPRYIWMTVP